MSSVEHRDFGTKEREKLSAKGQAMPGGGFPIRNRQDLKNAIQAYGRATNKVAAKAWIIKRAKELNLTDLLPDGWLGGETKQSNVIDFIKHHGVKGMRWGVRSRSGGGSSPSRQTARTTFEKSPKRLTSSEMEKRIRRMETEKRYNELNKRDISPGEKLATEILTNVGRTVLTTVATGATLLAIRTAVNSKMSTRDVARSRVGLKPLADVGAMITKRGK